MRLRIKRSMVITGKINSFRVYTFLCSQFQTADPSLSPALKIAINYATLCRHLSQIPGGDITCRELIVPTSVEECAGGNDCPMKTTKKRAKKQRSPDDDHCFCSCQAVPEVIQRLQDYHTCFPQHTWSSSVESKIEFFIATLPHEAQGMKVRAVMETLKTPKLRDIRKLLPEEALSWYSDENEGACSAILFTPLPDVPALVTPNGATWYDKEELMTHFSQGRSRIALKDPTTNMSLAEKLKAAGKRATAERAMSVHFLDVDSMLQRVMCAPKEEEPEWSSFSDDNDKRYRPDHEETPSGTPSGRAINVNRDIKDEARAVVSSFYLRRRVICSDAYQVHIYARELLDQVADDKTRRAVVASAIKKAGENLREAASRQQASSGTAQMESNSSVGQHPPQRPLSASAHAIGIKELEAAALRILSNAASPLCPTLFSSSERVSKPDVDRHIEGLSSSSSSSKSTICNSKKTNITKNNGQRIRSAKKELFFHVLKLRQKARNLARARKEFGTRNVKPKPKSPKLVPKNAGHAHGNGPQGSSAISASDTLLLAGPCSSSSSSISNPKASGTGDYELQKPAPPSEDAQKQDRSAEDYSAQATKRQRKDF
ncbi:unnamed protein product [Amoebophrya sp. A25]|nr:unnamed protein product [Amoebophrya sp. A25]|eukprot:GSA25T00000564001.1